MNTISVLTKVIRPPPLSCSRSFLMVVYPGMNGVFCVCISLVSWMVRIAILLDIASIDSSAILFDILFVLHWSMLSLVRFLVLVLFVVLVFGSVFGGT